MVRAAPPLPRWHPSRPVSKNGSIIPAGGNVDSRPIVDAYLIFDPPPNSVAVVLGLSRKRELLPNNSPTPGGVNNPARAEADLTRVETHKDDVRRRVHLPAQNLCSVKDLHPASPGSTCQFVLE